MDLFSIEGRAGAAARLHVVTDGVWNGGGSWDGVGSRGILGRRRLTARRPLFAHTRIPGGPSRGDALLRHRVAEGKTACGWSFKIVDSWKDRSGAHRELPFQWRGQTAFWFKAGARRDGWLRSRRSKNTDSHIDDILDTIAGPVRERRVLDKTGELPRNETFPPHETDLNQYPPAVPSRRRYRRARLVGTLEATEDYVFPVVHVSCWDVVTDDGRRLRELALLMMFGKTKLLAINGSDARTAAGLRAGFGLTWAALMMGRPHEWPSELGCVARLTVLRIVFFGITCVCIASAGIHFTYRISYRWTMCFLRCPSRWRAHVCTWCSSDGRGEADGARGHELVLINWHQHACDVSASGGRVQGGVLALPHACYCLYLCIRIRIAEVTCSILVEIACTFVAPT